MKKAKTSPQKMPMMMVHSKVEQKQMTKMMKSMGKMPMKMAKK